MNAWLAALLVVAAPVAADPVTTYTNADGTAGWGVFPVSRCLTDQDYQALISKLKLAPRAPGTESPAGVIQYADPIGIFGPGRSIVNYVDLDPSPGLRDYECGVVTYDGHNGIDIDIPTFYDMDEGVPILCAAPGIVAAAHDGEFDRQVVWNAGAPANYVVVQNQDGSLAFYYHMRKGSVAVQTGDAVTTGQVLGMVGSSGLSSGPHLHFETWDGARVDPNNGTCQPGPSWWASQPPYIWTQPFAVTDRGVTMMNLDWPTVLEKPPSKTHVKSGNQVKYWVRVRNVREGDQLQWKFNRGSIPQGAQPILTLGAIASGWVWAATTISTSLANNGNWRADVLYNGMVVSQTPFSVNGIVNQPATIAPQTFMIPNTQTFDGQFVGTDPDGSIFWYRKSAGPYHGTLEQYGGRARKFRYTPDPGFVGRDSVDLYAVDDENLDGPMSSYVFDVDVPTATLLAHFAGDWTDRGVELRWRFGTGARVASVTAERASDPSGPWSAVLGQPRDEAGEAVLLDRGAETDRTLYYRLIAIAGSGERRVFGPFAVTADARVDDGLMFVAPSPAHDRTRVEFSVAREAPVRLSVVDIQGRVVATLANAIFPAGRHEATWNAGGAAGLFFVRCEVAGRSSVRKVIVAP